MVQINPFIHIVKELFVTVLNTQRMPRKLTFCVVLRWDSTRVRLCFLTYKSNCANPMTTDESVKLELLRIAAALTKISIDKDLFGIVIKDADKTECAFNQHVRAVNKAFNDLVICKND